MEKNKLSMSIGEALSTLPPEIRAVIEGQLKRTATAKQFEHVSYSQYYDEVTEAGETKRSPSGISNTNVLKISHDKKAFGKRPVAVSLSRNRDGTLSISNAAFFPVSSVTMDKNGRVSLNLNDQFNAQEQQFINAWLKSKYVERAPKATATAPAPAVETAPAQAETSPAPQAVEVDPKVIKIALIKSKVKPTCTFGIRNMKRITKVHTPKYAM